MQDNQLFDTLSRLMTLHANSENHDKRYYTKTQIGSLLTPIKKKVTYRSENCPSSGDAVEKMITINDSDFKLEDGVRISVSFDNPHDKDSITLNVNNTGAVVVYFAFDGVTSFGPDDRVTKIFSSEVPYEFEYQTGTQNKWVFLGTTGFYRKNTKEHMGYVPAGNGHSFEVWGVGEHGTPSWMKVPLDAMMETDVDSSTNLVRNMGHQVGAPDVFFEDYTNITNTDLPSCIVNSDDDSLNRYIPATYGTYAHTIFMGGYAGKNGYNSMIVMPYNHNISDTELFISTQQGGTWRSFRRIVHEGNYGSIITPAGIGAVPASGYASNLRAGSAVNLTNASGVARTVGNVNKPVYFSNGIPMPCNSLPNAQCEVDKHFEWHESNGDQHYGSFGLGYNDFIGLIDENPDNVSMNGLIGFDNAITVNYDRWSGDYGGSTVSSSNYLIGDENIVENVLNDNGECSEHNANMLIGYDNKIRTAAENVNSAFLIGYNNVASAPGAKVFGEYLDGGEYQTVVGHYNKSVQGNSSSGTSSGNSFIIGNGTSVSGNNAFRVTGKGEVYASSSSLNPGADYAEYFEWADGNKNNEDRVGLFVTFEHKNKIRVAISSDKYILGIVSGNPAVCGNADIDWKGRYIRDDFGRIVEEHTTDIQKMYDQETHSYVNKEIPVSKWKENPEYDPTMIYLERMHRSEWDAIGMLGALPVYDNGECKEDGYCTVGDGGIAIPCEFSSVEHCFRVLERISNNVIKVLLRF